MDAHVKGYLLILLILSGTLQAASWTDRQGPVLSTTLGVGAIYIEEITEAGSLSAGATVLPLHGRLRYGTHVLPSLVVHASGDGTLYTDAESNLYLVSLFSVGLDLVLTDVGNTRLSFGGGLADKRIFGGDLSASGWGMQVGLTQPIANGFAVDIGYLYRQFSSVASFIGGGEQEYSSLLMLGLSYRWQ